MSVYRWSMRHASPILFWLALLIVILSIFNVYDTLRQTQDTLGVGLEGLQFFTRFRLLLSAVAQSFLLGAMPFGAAVIIHRIDKYLSKQGTQA